MILEQLEAYYYDERFCFDYKECCSLLRVMALYIDIMILQANNIHDHLTQSFLGNMMSMFSVETFYKKRGHHISSKMGAQLEVELPF